MYIAGLGTATPEGTYTQQECWEALRTSAIWPELEPRSQAILRKVLTGSSGIETRRLALKNLEDAFDMNPDALHLRFSQNAPLLAESAARKALESARLEPSRVDALLISTCTGYLCPGLTSYVSEALGLRKDTLLLDLVGQGCGAALPNLRTGEALLNSGSYRHILSVCVEVCSAAFYLDNDPGVLISACLFGDGAGAAVLSGSATQRSRIHWKRSNSVLEAGLREELRFEQRNGMLRNILRPAVPELASLAASGLLDRELSAAPLERSEIRGWVFHPGGRDVLSALQKQLGLETADLRWSASVLRKFGNISSASLYFVLQEALADGAPAGHWWMSSFGAGFSCHGALLEVN